jgi:hypothetical protein
MQALAFRAVLATDSAHVAKQDGIVIRTVALREDQTLEQLHEALRLAFGWADPHLYSFWIGKEWWNQDADEYTAPFAIDEMDEDKRSARVPVGELGLRKRGTMAYVFDFGDEWRLLIRLEDSWEPVTTATRCSSRRSARRRRSTWSWRTTSSRSSPRARRSCRVRSEERGTDDRPSGTRSDSQAIPVTGRAPVSSILLAARKPDIRRP